MKTLQPLKIYLFSILLLLIAVSSSAEPKALVVLSFSDLHGQLDPFASTDPDRKIKNGGIARMAFAVTAIRRLNPDRTLLFSCGDSLTGNYFLNFHGKAILSALELMNLDAATLGNHEFDRGGTFLARALNHCTFPIIQSNMELPEDSPLSGRFSDFRIIVKNGLTIGIIGLMTPDLPFISKADNIRVPADTAGSAVQIIKKMKKKVSPDIIIALTHIGLEKDIELAEKVPEIDLICGGHSHDLMQKGKETVIVHPDKTRTVIVHSGARGSHLGVLHMTVKKGNIQHHLWEPLKITGRINPDPVMVDRVGHYRKQLPVETVLALSEKNLDCRSESQRTRETKMGNLITDIIREYFETDVAFQNGGAIRGDWTLPAGNITTNDIDRLLPFENTVSIFELSGSEIRQVLEQSVSFLPRQYGGFLQVSGLRFGADLRKTPLKMNRYTTSGTAKLVHSGNRVSDIQVLDRNQKYTPLNPKKKYRIAVNTFLASGGDGYVIFQNKTKISTHAVLRSIVKNSLNRTQRIPDLPLDRIIIKQ